MKAICKIRDIYAEIDKFGEEFEKEYNISLMEGILLSTLKENNILSSYDLAKKTGLSFSNASKVIKSMEGQGFIIRSILKHDRRQVYFSLTDSGKAKIRKVKIKNLPPLLS